MPRRGKPGRKANNRGAAEKLLLRKFSEQLEQLLKDPDWNVERVRKRLLVSRASFFNYKAGTDLASFDVLKRAHDELGFSFPYMDFSTQGKPQAPRIDLEHAQGELFLDMLRQEDICVTSKKTVDRQTLELTVQVRFPAVGTRYRA